jgi:predicted ATPase
MQSTQAFDDFRLYVIGIGRMADQGILGHTHEIGVRWRNFRAFEDSGWLRIKPLTVFIGANNSGKSSLIEPLLLLKQSLLSRTGGNALLTRGTYHDSGSYRDFVHRHDAKSSVQFDLRWHSHPTQKDLAEVGTYPPGGAEFRFQQGDAPETIALDSYRVLDTHRRLMLRRQLAASGRYSLANKASGALDIGDERQDDLRRTIKRDLPIDFLFRSETVRNAALRIGKGDEDQPVTNLFKDPTVVSYCIAIDYVNFQLGEIFDKLFYVGPLREPAKRVYGLSGEMPPDVGTRGENAPEIIYRWRDRSDTLSELHRWLEHFEFNARLMSTSVGLEGFSLLLQHDDDFPTSFLDVGFGTSQVLPLIVQGLESPEESWMISEQPEIHLNPRLQAKLADFFVALANAQKGVIVETHSEHFLLRLRTLVAEERISADQVALYYVEPGDSQSSVRSVSIQENGSINREDWPAGFFEDSLREGLHLAKAQAARSS